MPKYLIENPDNTEEFRIDTSTEAMNVAYALALGVDPKKYGIDPFEAAALIHHVRDFALETKRSCLIISCDEALRRLAPDIQLFAIQIEKEREN